MGLNGIDNGALRFTHVRVPRENLLDRFGSVDRSGKYTSPVPSAGKRFAATLGELTGGRVGLVSGSVGVLKVCIEGVYNMKWQQVFAVHRVPPPLPFATVHSASSLARQTPLRSRCSTTPASSSSSCRSWLAATRCTLASSFWSTAMPR